MNFAANKQVNNNSNMKFEKPLNPFRALKVREYPKTLYIRQINNVVEMSRREMTDKGSMRTFTQVVKNNKHETEFRAQAASMEPNFTNDISEEPFPAAK